MSLALEAWPRALCLPKFSPGAELELVKSVFFPGPEEEEEPAHPSYWPSHARPPPGPASSTTVECCQGSDPLSKSGDGI